MGEYFEFWPHAVVIIYLLNLQKEKPKKQLKTGCALEHLQPNNNEQESSARIPSHRAESLS